MMKIMMYLDSSFFSLNLVMLMFIILLVTLIPESPVYYLLYMLMVSLFMLMYMSVYMYTNMYFYIFLIVAGGIMVTFLFFMVLNFSSKLNYNLLFFMLLIMLVMFIYIYLKLQINLHGNNMTSYELVNNDFIENCYVELFGIFLTMFCMTFLLFIMYLMVKISTNLKSSPMRGMK